MTQDEIKELAGHRTVSPWIIKLVSDAIAIGVEREREACAKVCEQQEEYGPLCETIWDCAAAIRARGEPTSRGQE